MSDLPIEHVRRPQLPWRDADRTECGLPCANHPVIDRDEFQAKVRRIGKQRSAMTTCMTCWETALRWPTWDEDPKEAIRREVYGARESERFKRELRAIAALIETHRDEFAQIIADLQGTIRIEDVRRNRSRR